MEIVVPVLIITFIVSLVLIPTIIDAWFMKETDKLNYKKDKDERDRDN